VVVKTARMPDGLFSDQKSAFGFIREGLGMDNVGIFYIHLVYFTALWYILWQFGTICGYLVYFSMFLYVVPRKIWQYWKYLLRLPARRMEVWVVRSNPAGV
jgi:hypothetical protein